MALFNGDLGVGNGIQDRIKADYLFMSLKKMNYDAANIGEMEFLYGFDYLREKIKADPKFISANLLDPSTGNPLFETNRIFRIKTLIDGKPQEIRVGVLGILSEDFKDELKNKGEGKEFIIGSVKKSLETWVPRVREKSDLVVVLFHGGTDEAQQLAQSAKGIDIMITGHEPYIICDNPRKFGKTYMVMNGDRGRFACRLNLGLNRAKEIQSCQGLETKMDETIKLDSDMEALVQAYKKSLSLSGTLRTGVKGELVSRYAGADSCQKCHPQAYTIWKSTGHADALDTLKSKNNDKREECLSCHVVGWSRSDGYVNNELTPQMAGVQCESCHGGGVDHLKASRDKKASAISKGAGPETCLPCHTKENSPAFNYSTYLPKIKHW